MPAYTETFPFFKNYVILFNKNFTGRILISHMILKYIQQTTVLQSVQHGSDWNTITHSSPYQIYAVQDIKSKITFSLLPVYYSSITEIFGPLKEQWKSIDGQEKTYMKMKIAMPA